MSAEIKNLLLVLCFIHLLSLSTMIGGQIITLQECGAGFQGLQFDIADLQITPFSSQMKV